jgi:DNA-binding response OmpR family regulator
VKVLIAEDDPVSRRVLQVTLVKWGYDAVTCQDGIEAWEALQKEDASPLAILDWMMPGLDGVEVCRKVRAMPDPRFTYIILLTAKGRTEDVVEGLGAGADDYLTKPFDREELQARLRVGVRVLELQKRLTERERENARLDTLAQATCALAHHIRNAITPIVGMAELSEVEQLPDGMSLKKVALQEGHRIAAVIDALIEMSESGVAPTVAYAGMESKQMLDLEPLIQRHLKKRLRP